MADSHDFKKFLVEWPTRSALLKDLNDLPGGFTYAQINAWESRNRIPVEHFPAIAEAAARRGYTDVTLEALEATEKARVAADEAERIAKRKLKHLRDQQHA